MNPVYGFRQNIDTIDAYPGFLAQLSQGRFNRRLSIVHTALRHLPGVAWVIDTLSGENFAGGVHHHQTDTRPVWQFLNLFRRHLLAEMTERPVSMSRA